MKTLEITDKSREAVQAITGLKADSVARCEQKDGGWYVVVDILESKARAGENDLIVTFELILDAKGDLTAYKRLRRYFRTDRGASDAA